MHIIKRVSGHVTTLAMCIFFLFSHFIKMATYGVFRPSIFCDREKLSRPLFQKKKKLAAFFVLKAPRAFFLSPSNEPMLEPDVVKKKRLTTGTFFLKD